MTMFLKTDNGTHPPEEWAMTTAKVIFPIEDSSLTGNSLIKAEKMRILIAESLIAHHANVQDHEKSHLSKNHARCEMNHDVQSYVDAAIVDIVGVSKGSPWESHFAKQEVQDACKLVLENHFQTAQHIERLWHADCHPKNSNAQMYKAKFHG